MQERRCRRRTTTVVVAALGVVFGDIGTSPLYAMRECFAGGLAPTPAHVLGVASLLFWAIIIVVALKYVSVVLRADNRGEGGVLALMALALRSTGDRPRLSRAVTAIGLTGAALFFGDAMVTPAISVLSAVEGIHVTLPQFSHGVIPITLAILVGLFAVQHRGTARVGRWFGPVMVAWFVLLGIMGANSVAHRPEVLAALLPSSALGLVAEDPLRAFLLLGAVVLALTGAEALYADMGHFNKRSIRLAWFVLAMPALVLNYLGQGALLLANPAALDSPFYRLAPAWALMPLVVLASVATVIASQAVISGAYSIVRQAMLLHYWPRMTVRHTSADEHGQIYMPGVNWGLMAGVVILVVGFGSSSNLAAAYGFAVTGTMVATTLMVMVVARRLWKWSWLLCVGVGGPLLLVDGLFLASNSLKIPSGGWLPLTTAALFLVLMTTWRQGKRLVAGRLQHDLMALEDFVAAITVSRPRTMGTAIFLTSIPEIVPPALLHNLRHNDALHAVNIIVAVSQDSVAHIRADQRCTVQALGAGFHLVRIRFGFMEEPDVPETLARCCPDLVGSTERVTFFIGREAVRAAAGRTRAPWRQRLFCALSRNAADATTFFHLPLDRVVEIGVPVEI